jgi:hypothetical protein
MTPLPTYCTFQLWPLYLLRSCRLMKVALRTKDLRRRVWNQVISLDLQFTLKSLDASLLVILRPFQVCQLVILRCCELSSASPSGSEKVHSLSHSKKGCNSLQRHFRKASFQSISNTAVFLAKQLRGMQSIMGVSESLVIFREVR